MFMIEKSIIVLIQTHLQVKCSYSLKIWYILCKIQHHLFI